jgi:hypothetical protein
LNRRRQPFQYYQRIPLVLQQLNFAEGPQFCDHSVTSADVRLSVGSKAKHQRFETVLRSFLPRHGFLLSLCPNHESLPTLSKNTICAPVSSGPFVPSARESGVLARSGNNRGEAFTRHGADASPDECHRWRDRREGISDLPFIHNGEVTSPCAIFARTQLPLGQTSDCPLKFRP